MHHYAPYGRCTSNRDKEIPSTGDTRTSLGWWWGNLWVASGISAAATAGDSGVITPHMISFWKTSVAVEGPIAGVNGTYISRCSTQ